MSVFPKPIFSPLVHITPYSLESLGFALRLLNIGNGIGGAASAVYPAANKAYFFPFFLSTPTVFQNAFVYNGTVVSGNVDIGIYSQDGTKIVSTGTTLQAGTSVIQPISLSSTELGPGVYYMALAVDNTTATVFRVAPANSAYVDSVLGMAEMATAFVLPATATFASLTTDYFPVFGISTRSVV